MHTGNRWAENGSRAGAWGKFVRGKIGSATESGISSLLVLLGCDHAQLFHLAQEIALQVGILAENSPGTGHHHDVIAGDEFFLVGTVQRSDTAAGKITLDRLAQLDAGGDAETALFPTGLAAIDDKIRGHRAFSLVVKAAELMIQIQGNGMFHDFPPVCTHRGGGISPTPHAAIYIACVLFAVSEMIDPIMLPK